MPDQPRPIVSLDGIWVEIDPPTEEELATFQRESPRLPASRVLELRAWSAQVRMTLNQNDRRFLRSLRIQPWD